MDCYLKKTISTWINNDDLNGTMIDIAKTRRRACNALLPDEFWIVNGNECEEVYTVGSDLANDTFPSTIMGVPVKRQARGGKMTYTGPGQLVLAFNVSGSNLRKLHGPEKEAYELVANYIVEPIKEYLNANFNLALTFDAEDPGLYDQNGAKVVSYGFSIPSGYIIFYCTINLAVDLTKYSIIDVCGRSNRPMRNVYDKVGIDSETIITLGDDIIKHVWQTLYKPANNVYEYQGNEPVLIR